MSGQLVLASASPYRRQQLSQLGVEFVTTGHQCNEREVTSAYQAPDAIAIELARGKALSVVEKFPAAHILGSDQLVDFEEEVLGKPGDEQGAMAQLGRLAGRSHRLLTAVALRRPDGGVETALDVHTMHMRALTPAEIARYVAAERPVDCAGSYKIEALGITLFDRIDGPDFTAIVGLPLLSVSRMLRQAGFALP